MPARFRRWAAVGVVVGVGACLSAGAGGERLKTRHSETLGLEAGQTATVAAKCPRGTRSLSGGFETDFVNPAEPALVSGYGSRKRGARTWEARAWNHNDIGWDGEVTGLAYCRNEKLATRTKSTEVEGTGGVLGNYHTGSIEAKCPRGTKAISGGFDHPDFLVGLNPAFIDAYESRKTGKRSWRTSGQNVGEPAGELVAQVVCHEGKALKTRRATEAIPPFEPTEVAVKCKRGQRVVSGGFAFEVPREGSTFGPVVTDSHKQGKRIWVTTFDNTNETDEVTAYAYCERP